MWLQLGAKNTLVVSSAEVAMELFKKHDLTISNRAVNESVKVNKYDQVSIGFAPYGTYWRMMRRIEIFAATAQFLEFISKPNVADFFPWMRWLDPQRIKKKVKKLMGITIGLSSALVEERVLDRQKGKRTEKKDFLDVMLDFKGNHMDGEPTKLPKITISIGILVRKLPKITI
ncbi:cytochrome P450 76A2-like [Thalictrum thalictroides]|uniref:Cytochrome P450 76A2-like n=1 Tax=Thalictrum thalictroides TaxID=46969 RepID=A0A7J6W9T0_THATH|nr:cytochrome P450 76A2-like [Thalictrum thalictroides]